MNDAFYQNIPAADMPSCASDFRRRARERLRDQLGNGIAVTLIKQLLPLFLLTALFAIFMLCFVMTIFSDNSERFADAVLIVILLMMLGSTLISAPLGAGACRFWLNVADGSPDARVDNVFSVLRKGYWKSVRVVFVQIAAVVVIAFVGLIALAVCSDYMTDDYNATEQGTAVFFTAITVIAMLWLACRVMLRYAFSFYVLIEHPELDTIEILHTSAKLIRGNRWRFFCLMCSFLGWFLLATFFSGGIGYLFLIPYVSVSQAEFYREVTGTAVRQASDAPFSAEDFLSKP